MRLPLQGWFCLSSDSAHLAGGQHSTHPEDTCSSTGVLSWALESGRVVPESQCSSVKWACNQVLAVSEGAGWPVHSGCPIQTPRPARVPSSLPLSGCVLPALSTSLGSRFLDCKRGMRVPTC